MHFTQAKTHNNNQVYITLSGIYRGASIKTPIYTRIPISKDRLAIFTNYPSVTKDQALEETVLTLFHHVVHGCFQFVSVIIQLPIMNVVKG